MTPRGPSAAERRSAPWTCLVLCCLLAASNAVGGEASTTGRVIADIPYRTIDREPSDGAVERARLDLYLPAQATGFPTLVWFHGGGLKQGDKSDPMTVAIARRFAADGIAVAAVNYRRHPKVEFPVYVDDAAASVAWAKVNMSRYGGDPERLFVAGHSAGGYLAAMVALDPTYLGRYGQGPEGLAGVIPVSGQMVTHSTVRQERGIAPTTPLIDHAAPSFHVRANAPAFLCICGSDDLPARAEENRYFVAAMKAAGHRRVEYLEVPGRDHGTIASGIPDLGDAVARAVVKCIAETVPVAAGAAPQRRPHEGHAFVAADSSKRRIARISAAGELEWEYRIGSLHDLHVLAGGNVLFQTSFTRLVEVDPERSEIVWEYDAARQNAEGGRRVEVHAFERLEDGRTMIAESGRARIIEVDREGNLLHEVALPIERPQAHHDTRLVRKLPSGNYLVCHEALGTVREYDPRGAIVWEYEVPLFGRERGDGHGLEAFGNAVFSAVRLANGNTLIGTGNGHSVLEVTAQKEIVWSVHQDDLEGVRLAWVTTLEVLPNGNVVIGNCHAGPENPQLVEVTRDKEVVWSYRNFDLFGNAFTNTQILGAGDTIR